MAKSTIENLDNGQLDLMWNFLKFGKAVYDLKTKGYSFNQISKMLNLDWGCVKHRYDDFIHDNPELLKEG